MTAAAGPRVHASVTAYDHQRDGGPHIADLHQSIRQWQVATGHNAAFGDDSRPDLTDIPGAYLTRGGGFWVARHDPDGVIGFIALRRTGPRAGEVKRFAVAPVFHGLGVGTRLVAALMGWARAEGLAELTLSTGRGEQARGIYERAGFQVIGYDPVHDDDRMRADLAAGD